jgi:hypothetical protein
VPKEWLYYRIMKTMHWDWWELLETPIPVLEWIIKCIKIENDYRESQLKGIGK